MSPPGTFERVYTAIKEQLRKGAFRPGERLEPSALSDRLNSSVTPVRDALHRLTGERLVEAPRHEGFRAPLLTEIMLRHLYAWHLDLLLLATARHHWGPMAAEAAPTPASASVLDRANALFLRLAEAGGNPELVHALRTLAERMEPYQHFEKEFLDSIEAETADIAKAVAGCDRRALRKSLMAYNRRRARLVPELVARARSTSPGSP